MKKIFLFLFLVYSSSFAYTLDQAKNHVANRVCQNVFFTHGDTEVDSSSCNPTYSVSEALVLGPGSDFQTGWKVQTRFVDTLRADGSTRRTCNQESSSTTYQYCTFMPNPNPSLCPSNPYSNQNGKIFECNPENGEWHQNVNPDPLGGDYCRELFQKDGQAYSCNPNTNEATLIPDSNGVTIDPDDGKDIPNCNEGYEWDSTPVFPSHSSTSGGYNQYSCNKAVFNPDGSLTGDNGTIIHPDGSITYPKPDGSKERIYQDGSKDITSPDGTVTHIPAPSTGTGTDSGTGTTGTTGTDSGSGSSTGGTSGTGSTGGTTGTDTGTGSTGGTTGTTDGGSTGGTSSSGGVGSSTTTGGTGSTTGTDTGTGSTGGTTGTDSGTGSTNGTGSTGTTETPTEEPEKAGSCGSPNMTLLEKTLCETKALFSTLPKEGGQELVDDTNGVSSGLGSSYDGLVSLVGDMRSSYTTITNQLNDTRQFFQTGFTFNPIQNIVNSSNLEQCLTISVFGDHKVFMDFISPLIYIKPITTLIIQILMLIEVLRMCFLIINYTRSIF